MLRPSHRWIPGLLALLACTPRTPTADPAEPLPPPSCLTAAPSALRFTAVGEALPLEIAPCDGAPATVTAHGLERGTAFTLEAPPAPWKVPSFGRILTVRFAGPAAAHDVLWLQPEGAEGPLPVALLGPEAGQGCPLPQLPAEALGARPLQVLSLDGSAARPGPSGAPLTAWRFEILDRPPGSTAHVVERISDPEWPQRGGPADDPGTPGAAVFLDLAGRYRIGLTVEDAHGRTAPGPDCPGAAHLIVDAVPDAAIHIQLVWDTPDDPDQTDLDGSDLDLHLRRQGGRFGGQEGCYYAQRHASWPPAGPDGDAHLDIDDIDGQGPENINLPVPHAAGAPYEIGVHAFRLYTDALGQVRPSEATVRVYLDGSPAAAWRRVFTDHDHFWTVARITLDAEGELSVVAVDRLSDHMP